MKAYTVVRDPETGAETLETPLSGSLLLDCPMLNKGSAFSADERSSLGLLGLLPPHVATMDEQLVRTYENYQQKTSAQERHIFLTSLQDRNETLFYRLLSEHITEMLPMIYTPVVGITAQHYSHIYRRPRGLYVDYPHRDSIEAMLHNAANSDVRAIVVTDGERVLGLGDLGIGGMEISVGKLTLYSLCAGIHPATTLPIHLDIGTDNQSLLDDPLYLGWRHERVRGAEYDAFIEAFVTAVMRVFPNALLQWEDFAKQNARRLLDRYRDRLCSFNDDIQGTGAVTLAGLLAAMGASGSRLRDQRIVMLGAGSAATGICEQIVAAVVADGGSEADARAAIWLVDSHGPVHDGRQDLDPAKRAFAQPLDRAVAFHLARPGGVTLEDVVRQVHPTILIGTAAQPGAFSEPIVREMLKHTEHPIIFPLSNPTSRCEAAPVDLLAWTQGRALIATGSPFPDVVYRGRTVRISQCNNVLIFPGVALGVLASGARRVVDSMFVAAARTLSEQAPIYADPGATLFPPLGEVRSVSRRIALAVGAAAQQAGVAEPSSPEALARNIDALIWAPHYTPIQRT
ncbi:MAG: NAD-dependent malic enzyme [Kouleothrix sp.]|jgi:malate dehydrogenase (oxaloacetate-decarboxylating)|nr:NAD-dependent malic enzyme [Kouleothrix sp.]